MATTEMLHATPEEAREESARTGNIIVFMRGVLPAGTMLEAEGCTVRLRMPMPYRVEVRPLNTSVIRAISEQPYGLRLDPVSIEGYGRTPETAQARMRHEIAREAVDAVQLDGRSPINAYYAVKIGVSK